MKIYIYYVLLVCAVVLGILSVICFKPIAERLGDKVDKFFYKEPRGGWRELVIKAGTFYVRSWRIIYLTGAFLVMASVMGTHYFWWPFAIPFIIWGAGFMAIGWEMKRRIKNKFHTKQGDRHA
jgi:hypothetical protein